VDFPKHFVWKNKTWQQRKRGGEKVISRLYFVNPKDEERFYLRTLLYFIPGAKSFEFVRTINGVTYNTFKEAAYQLGLVDDDNECDACLKEAATYQMPIQLRQLFASILVYCQPASVKALWDDYVDALIEDFIKKGDDKNLSITKTLIDIEKYLIQNGMTLSDFPELPKPDYSLLEEDQQTTLIAEEQNYDQDEIEQTLEHLDNLNPEQRLIFDTILKAINNEIDQNVFFVDGPGGTGKTFLYNMILAHVRSSKLSTSGLNGIAIAVASSGIAALLMSGGRTAHSRFKIPLKLTETTTLNIEKQSDLATLIRTAKVILWDEAPMLNKKVFEAVDRTFKDLMNNNEKLFGGKVVVLGGDFRQILPVVIRGTRGQIVDARLKA